MKSVFVLAVLVSGLSILSSSFLQAQCLPGTFETIITVTPSGFPGEISWDLVRTSDTTILLQTNCGDYSDGLVSMDSLCLVAGVDYTFRAYDDWGDGWAGGTYEVRVNSFVVGSGSPNNGLSGDNSVNCDSLDLEETFSFVPGAAVAGCTDPAALNYNPIAVIDDGSCLYPAANDECEDAIMLAIDDCYIGSNIGATYSASAGTIPPSYACAGVSFDGTVADIWFSVIVPPTGIVGVDLPSVPGISSSMLFLSGSCGNLMPFSGFPCANYGPGNGIILPGLTPGDTLYIRYWDFGSDEFGSYEICISSPYEGCTDPCAANFDPLANVDDGSCTGYSSGGSDDCTTATPLSGPGTYSHYNGGATGGESSSCITQDSTSIWFSYPVGTAIDSLLIYTCGTNYDTGLSLWSGCDTVGSEISCNDDGAPGGGSSCGGWDLQSYILLEGAQLDSLEGSNILIRISGIEGATGCGDLVIEEIEEIVPPIDTCSPSLVVQNFAATVGGGTLDLSWEPIPGSVGCQVNFGVSGTSLGGSQNLIGFELSGVSIPLAFIPPGSFDMRVRCGCQITPSVVVTQFSDTLTVNIPAPRITADRGELTIYPNPASTTINVQVTSATSETGQLVIQNLVGQRLFVEPVNLSRGDNTFSLDLESLSNGYYLVSLQSQTSNWVGRFEVMY